MAGLVHNSNKVQTVLGLVDPEELGITLTHEHLFMTFECCYVPPKEHEKEKQSCAFTLENLGWIRQNPYSHNVNLLLNDAASEATILEEMGFYVKNGGGAIVENTTHGIQRNVAFLKEISQKTGVKIVAGTGFYVAGSQSHEVLQHPVETLSSIMNAELTMGCIDASDVRCGIIGEIGCSWPLHDFEKNIIHAAAEVQSKTGCPVTFHPGRNNKAPFEIIRLYQEAGGDTSKAVMSHLERTIFDKEELLEFASLGTFCQFDLFGNECSYYQLNEAVDMPSDAQRIQLICYLVDEGFSKKLLVAHDIHTKSRLMKFGGHGYSHILTNVVPKMLNRGISQQVIDLILKENPKAWLTYK